MWFVKQLCGHSETSNSIQDQKKELTQSTDNAVMWKGKYVYTQLS